MPRPAPVLSADLAFITAPCLEALVNPLPSAQCMWQPLPLHPSWHKRQDLFASALQTHTQVKQISVPGNLDLKYLFAFRSSHSVYLSPFIKKKKKNFPSPAGNIISTNNMIEVFLEEKENDALSKLHGSSAGA